MENVKPAAKENTTSLVIRQTHIEWRSRKNDVKKYFKKSLLGTFSVQAARSRAASAGAASVVQPQPAPDQSDSRIPHLERSLSSYCAKARRADYSISLLLDSTVPPGRTSSAAKLAGINGAESMHPTHPRSSRNRVRIQRTVRTGRWSPQKRKPKTGARTGSPV